ncbi:hypothetical protein FZI93_08845 [Mycobacterium sp. CBMA361]|nr:hypothetical protein [Mycolicibacterium sp. CBMA 213]MUM04460.1 hypothetical protein [Mycolicibacterium sp. CBMA 213]MUM31920.1 hypothetical protein [Mycolicibacterium sp. CBMA 361]
MPVAYHRSQCRYLADQHRLLMPAGGRGLPIGVTMIRTAPVVDEDFDLDEAPAVHWANTNASQSDSPVPGMAERQ